MIYFHVYVRIKRTLNINIYIPLKIGQVKIENQEKE